MAHGRSDRRRGVLITILLGIIIMCISEYAVAADRSAQSEPQLESVHWQLQEYLGESGEMTPVLPDTSADSLFTQGQLTGSTGCNRYFGRYTTGEDNQLTLASEVGATQMACPGPVMQQEQRYLALLSRATVWQRQDASLLLLDEQQQPLLRYAAATPIALENTRWEALGINNGRGGVVSRATTDLATALFADGKLSGDAGCNQFSASYETDGNRITIGPAMATRKHCAVPDGIMEQERQYLQALARAHTYTLKPAGLELRDEKGSLQVSYGVQKP